MSKYQVKRHYFLEPFTEQKFAAFPSLGYWEIDGKPVSSADARAVGWFAGGAKWRETEVARNLGHYLDSPIEKPPEKK